MKNINNKIWKSSLMGKELFDLNKMYYSKTAMT